MFVAASVALLSVVASAKPQVMLLGTYHFANPGLDAVKVMPRDTMGSDRQAEIKALNESLARFKPTKILVESTPERQPKLDEQFHAYLRGAPLTADERQQIGFRLAKQFGHKTLIGVDYQADMDFDRIMAFAQANNMPDVPARMGQLIEKMGRVLNDLDARYTVSQILAIHNDPFFIRFSQRFYTDLLSVQKAPEYPAADVVAGWYRRNLVIYENIREALKPGDRALVIYGSGHVYYLKQLLEDGDAVDLVDVRKFLPKSPIRRVPGF